MQIRSLLFLALAPVCAGCGDIRELMSLQQGIAKEFPYGQVWVEVASGRSMTITFQNPPDSVLAAPGASLCQRIGAYVRDHYAGFERLESIRIDRSTVRHMGPVKTTRTDTECSITPSEVREAAGGRG